MKAEAEARQGESALSLVSSFEADDSTSRPSRFNVSHEAECRVLCQPWPVVVHQPSIHATAARWAERLEAQQLLEAEESRRKRDAEAARAAGVELDDESGPSPLTAGPVLIPLGWSLRPHVGAMYLQNDTSSAAASLGRSRWRRVFAAVQPSTALMLVLKGKPSVPVELLARFAQQLPPSSQEHLRNTLRMGGRQAAITAAQVIAGQQAMEEMQQAALSDGLDGLRRLREKWVDRCDAAQRAYDRFEQGGAS